MRIVVLAVVILFLAGLLVGLSAYPKGAFGGGGGGGWGEPQDAGAIVIPPWLWTWFGWLILDYAITPITDCIREGTCTQSDGPLGGGGGGGFGGDGPVNYPNNARSAPKWDWLTFQKAH